MERRIGWAQTARGSRAPLTHDALAELQSGLMLYRGDLLAGLHVPGSRGFDAWAVTERERMRRLAIEGLRTLLAHQSLCGEHAAAIETAMWLLQLDPLQEDIQRQVMWQLAITGQRGAAVAQYEACRRILAVELDAAPAEETTALYEQIRSGSLQRVVGQV
jgi:DNA-binding SARP family transcriptional activator